KQLGYSHQTGTVHFYYLVVHLFTFLADVMTRKQENNSLKICCRDLRSCELLQAGFSKRWMHLKKTFLVAITKNRHAVVMTIMRPCGKWATAVER
ncbi:hypothetical protein GOODEAATRI_006318, partial [Goodea atripinnis]